MGDWWNSVFCEVLTLVHAVGHAYMTSPEPVFAAIYFVVACIFFWVGRETVEVMPYGNCYSFAGAIVSSYVALLAILPGKLEIFVYPALSIVVVIVVWFGVLTSSEKQKLGNAAIKLREMSRRVRGRFTAGRHDQ